MQSKARPILVNRAAKAQAPAGPGDSVEVTVSEVSPDEVRFQLADGRDGVAEAAEFTNPPANGDKVRVTFLMTDPAGSVVHATPREPIAVVDPKTPPKGQVVIGNVVEMNRAGLGIDVGGVRGFLPLAQIGRGLESVPAEFQRGRVAAEVRGVDSKRGEIMLGLRGRLDRREDRQKQQAMTRLEEGQVLEGKIVRMNQHGAFVDLGGVDGLLHQSRIQTHFQESDSPQKVEVGEFVKIEILRLDLERGRIGLAFPREEDDAPTTFSDLVGEYAAGENVTGLVQDVSDDGCTILLDEQVKGWLAKSHYESIGVDIRRGALVQAAVEGIDLDEQRIRLRPRD